MILPTERNGINGNALYFFEKNGEVIAVIKPEYLQSKDYNVKIRRDTLQLGEEFLGMLSVYRENFRIRINSPTQEIINGDARNQAPDYKFTASQPGKFSFAGTIEHDTVSVPFSYKFIVLPPATPQ